MLRQLNSADVNEFRKLRLETLQSDPGSWLSTWSSEKDLPLSVFENRITYWSSFPTFGYYGYFDNDMLLAYILISPNHWPNKKHIINMSDFAVSINARRHGIGKKVVENIVEIIKTTAGIEQIQLFVNSGNVGAINFYEKLGFTKVATIPNNVKNSNGDYQDEYVYTLKI